jgi:hypothetical protein
MGTELVDGVAQVLVERPNALLVDRDKVGAGDQRMPSRQPTHFSTWGGTLRNGEETPLGSRSRVGRYNRHLAKHPRLVRPHPQIPRITNNFRWPLHTTNSSINDATSESQPAYIKRAHRRRSHVSALLCPPGCCLPIRVDHVGGANGTCLLCLRTHHVYPWNGFYSAGSVSAPLLIDGEFIE